MPNEKFYAATTVEGGPPHLSVGWGVPTNPDGKKLGAPSVRLNGETYDRSGLNRLIGTLRRARDQVYGGDE